MPKKTDWIDFAADVFVEMLFLGAVALALTFFWYLTARPLGLPRLGYLGAVGVIGVILCVRVVLSPRRAAG